MCERKPHERSHHTGMQAMEEDGAHGHRLPPEILFCGQTGCPPGAAPATEEPLTGFAICSPPAKPG